MASQYKPPIVISITQCSGGLQKSVKITRGQKRSNVRVAVRRSTPSRPSAPAKTAKRVATAAVATTAVATAAVLGAAIIPALLPRKKSTLGTCAELVGDFAELRRQFERVQEKRTKAAIKKGYDPEIGLYRLEKLPKLKRIKKHHKAKRIKPYKAPRIRKGSI